MSSRCTSHQLPLSVHAPRRWRPVSSSRGHWLGEDTDFPLGPNRRWCQVTLFLLCYQQRTCLHALTEAAPASLCRSFKAFAPGKQDENGSGFSQYANRPAIRCQFCFWPSRQPTPPLIGPFARCVFSLMDYLRRN